MRTLPKIAIGIGVAATLGLAGGYIIGQRRLSDCRAQLLRSDEKARSAKAALAEEHQQAAEKLAAEHYARLLAETRAQLLQALTEVHAKNFGLASQYIQTAAKQLARLRKLEHKDKQLDELARHLSSLHERTMLLDARVTEQLRTLVGKLLAIAPSTPVTKPARLKGLGNFLRAVLARLREVLRYVLHIESFLALGVISLLLGLLERMAALPQVPATAVALCSRLLWAGYFYLVLRQAAAGSRRLPSWSNYHASWETLIYPLVQGLVSCFWYLLLLIVLVRQTIGLHEFSQQFQLRALDFFRRPQLLTHLLLFFALIQVPPALAASAHPRSGLLRLLDPTYGIRLVTTAANDYLITFVALQFLLVASFLTGTVAALLEQALPIPLAAPVLRYLLQLWVWLAQARLLGDFVARSLADASGTLRP